jgi:CBS domain-containing protein
METTARHLLQVKGFDTWFIAPEAAVYDALRLMADKNVGALLVMKSEKLLGVFSERDYARKIILMGKSSKNTKVFEIMAADPVTVHPDQTVQECMEIMTDRHVRHLPVVENEKIIGMVSIGDVVRSIIFQQKKSIQDLEARVTRDKAKSGETLTPERLADL